MKQRLTDQSGVSLIEAMVAMLVLTIGAMGLASVFVSGMRNVSSGENELIATQKAAEAVESVFGARDSHTLAWAQLRNANNSGVFLTGARAITVAGADGIVNTADDGAIESVTFPGRDQVPGTADDVTKTLKAFTREIRIADISADLRSITVIITYPAGSVVQHYTLTAYMSVYA